MVARTKIRRGHVLLAEPFMLDPYFRRAAVLLCEHNPEGSLGFIMNKSTNLRINDLIEDFPAFEAEVFYGGPVSTDTLHFVHNLGGLINDSIPVADGVWWGGDFEEMKFMITSGLVEPGNVRFFVGYSGWSGGQLDEEMEIGSWVTADMHANYLFKSPPEGLWSQVMYNKGDLFEIIAEVPEEMSWN